jgi:hypothetical protein
MRSSIAAILCFLLLPLLSITSAHSQGVTDYCAMGDNRACAYLKNHCDMGDSNACQALVYALCRRGNQRACQYLQSTQGYGQPQSPSSPRQMPGSSPAACLSNCTNQWVWCSKACRMSITLDDEDIQRQRICSDGCDKEKRACEANCR